MEVYEHAKAIADQRAEDTGKLPIINCYEFDESILHNENLRVKIFQEYTIEWADFVYKNRNGDEVEKYDIVYGPIADDRIGLQIRFLHEGIISIDTFLERIKYHRGITYQFYFGSERALSNLKRLEI